MHSNQIRCEDCFKFLPLVADRSVQTVFVDPPYNIGFDYGNGGADDRLPAESYLASMDLLIRHCERTLSPTGSLWFLCPERWADQIGAMLSARLPRRNRIIWRETFSQYRQDRFPNGHRHLFWHVKDAKLTPFYTDAIRVASQRMKNGDSRASGPRVPDDVWQIPRLTGNSAERVSGHPCQIPEALLERIVLCSSQPGELVLDPMAGAGSTLVVARRLGRRYLGCERDPKFAQLIEKRLEQDYQPNLF